jgi:hypothetical protein
MPNLPKEDFDMSTSSHARLAPSAASRWMRCPGSVPFVESLNLPSDDNDFTREGTGAHELGELCLLMGVDPDHQDLPTAAENGVPFDADMREHVGKYVDFVRATFGAPGAHAEVEQWLDMSAAVPHCSGTADVLGTLPSPDGGVELVVVDLKYGRGVRVDAEGNPQLRLYALGGFLKLVEQHRISSVRTIVHQPRLDHVSEETMTPADLEEFAQAARKAALRVEMADAAATEGSDALRPWLKPSDEACCWCPAKAVCPELRAKIEAEVGLDFDVVDPKAPGLEAAFPGKGTSTDRLGRDLALVPLIEAWTKAVRVEVVRRLLTGTPVTGWKLVRGRLGPRQWVDDEAVAQYLRKTVRLPIDETYDLKLISPTSAEKLFNAGKLGSRQWERLQPHITRVEGQPSVAPESDERDPFVVVKPSADDFVDESTPHHRLRTT